MPNIHSIGFRVVVIVGGLMSALVAVLFASYVQRHERTVVDGEVHAARSLILMAESVRENMEQKWRYGLFSPAALRNVTADTPEQRERGILAAVPVVAAWEAAKAKAHEGGFEFRTPRAGARNPENEPDEPEQQALRYFQDNPNASEYYLKDEARNAIRYFRPVRLGAICMSCHGDPAKSAELWGRDDGKDILGHPMEGKSVGDLHGAFEIIRPLDEADAALRTSLLQATGIALVVLVTGILGTGWLVRRLVGMPIEQAVHRLVRAQDEGDLRFRLDDSGKDELALLASGFNRFVARIQDFTGGVIGAVGSVAAAVDRMSSVTRQTNQGMQQQQTEIDQVATAMNEMAATVQEVARSAAQAARAVQQVQEEAGGGQRVVSQTVEAIDALAEDVKNAAQVIQELEKESEGVSVILDVIRNIAEQTNLLALNAAIEAARAGEQGRGFAVVADEVRTLAQRTQSSTSEIQQLIQRLQARANQAVQVMEKGRGQARETVRQAGQAGESLSAITHAVGTMADMNAQIASAAEEQSAVAEEINRNVVNISQVAAQTVQGAGQIAAASEELDRLAAQLQAKIGQFRV